MTTLRVRQRLVSLLLGGLLASGTAVASECAQPVGRDFESAAPAEMRLSAGRISEILDALDEARFDVKALLILHDCKIVLERYKSGIGREHNHTLYSTTKSVAATLVGALLLQGKIKSVDVSIADLVSRPLLIDDSNWEKARQITLKNAMQMASGLEYKHDPCCHPIYDVREDRLVAALLPPLTSTPGTRYLYSDGDASLVGAAISGAAGVDLLSFARAAVFEPLNMSNVDWMFRDRTGRFPGGWGLRLRPMDMLKIGQLYLQGGLWNGRRVFAEDFAQQAWAPGVDQGYASGWRIANPKAFGTPYFWAQGFKGQRIFVFPEWNIVVAISATLPGSEESRVMRIVVPGLVDARRKGPDVAADSLATLKAKEGSGFRGETRTQQENQDAPRRF